MTSRFLSLTSIAVATVFAFGAKADGVEDFYSGKTIDLYIGYSVGGGYDTYARLVARHMGRHIPGNPTLVPQNMPGAGSLKLTNWLYAAAPQDGTAFGVIARAAPFDPLFGNERAEFDAKQFNYLGSANNEVSICAAMAETGIETVEDLRNEELIVGGTGDTADTVQFPKIVNAVLGTQMQIINGYPGGNDVVLAMERGEVNGRCGWSWSSVKSTRSDWVAEGKINLLLQISTAKHPDLPDVPLIMDFAQSEDDRDLLRLAFARQALGRPFVAPPNVPEDRMAALRTAFMATMTDPEFLAEAAQADLEVAAISGDEVQALVEAAYRTDPSIVDRIKEILN